MGKDKGPEDNLQTSSGCIWLECTVNVRAGEKAGELGRDAWALNSNCGNYLRILDREIKELYLPL